MPSRLPPAVSVTVRQWHPEITCPPGLMPEEKDAVQAVYNDWPEDAEEADTEAASSLRVSLDADLFRVDAWPALPERNGYRRVCLVTHPHDAW